MRERPSDALLEDVDDVGEHRLLGRRVPALLAELLVLVGGVKHAVLEGLNHVVGILVEVVVAVLLALAPVRRLLDDLVNPPVERRSPDWKGKGGVRRVSRQPSLGGCSGRT
jgi:hypothetical protein